MTLIVRLRFLILAGAIILLALFMLPTYNAYPQDITPTILPTVDGTTTLAAVPFGDTFEESQAQWQPSGGWYFDPEGGYEGGGWVLDGLQASRTSTLEYLPFIDLHGTLGAQIMFRQRGSLPISDLVVVEISLDGGTTWFIVDSQIGVQPPIEMDESGQPQLVEGTEADEGQDDWILREIRLPDYRNQVIRLRFRVQTGLRLPDQALTETIYQVDNLSIQFYEEYVYKPLFGGPRTLLGLHIIVGGNSLAVMDLVKRLRDAGWPMGTIKGTSGTEALLQAVAQTSPETIIVYRSLETPRGMIDCPNSFQDPVAEANAWMAGLWPEWEGVPADYFEIMNECFPPFEWMVPFTIEAMRLAGERGHCLLVLSYAVGNPEPYQYTELLPIYKYALEHPCQPGRTHGIALHAYAVDKGKLLSESGIWLGLRYRLYYEQLLPELPEAAQIPVFLTEASPGDGSTPFSCEVLTRDMIQYTQQVEHDPYIAGFHLWNIGSPQFHWNDVSDCLPMLGDALVNYYSSK